MTKSEREAYKKEVSRVAKTLGLATSGNVEENLVRHFEHELEIWIAKHGQPATLSELADLFSASLGMSFEEIQSDADLGNLLERFPPEKDLVMARVEAELDDNTEAVTIHRKNHKPWERPFLAIINCRGRHNARRFFSKWHEIVHRLVEGNQLQFAFRHTPIKELRKDPFEVLVDHIAAALAFYPGMFNPVFFQEYRRSQRLNLSVIDRIREVVAPDASRQATLLACIKVCPAPVWHVYCAIGYKREEQRQIDDLLRRSPEEHASWPEPKLRVLEAASSPAAADREIRIHPHMRVPDLSIVARAFSDPSGRTHLGVEELEIWETSSDGSIGYGTIEVEAIRIDDGVSAFIRLVSGSVGSFDEKTVGTANLTVF